MKQLRYVLLLILNKILEPFQLGTHFEYYERNLVGTAASFRFNFRQDIKLNFRRNLFTGIEYTHNYREGWVDMSLGGYTNAIPEGMNIIKSDRNNLILLSYGFK